MTHLEVIPPVNPFTFVNLSLALSVVIISIYFILRGRKVDRVFMYINCYAGLWVVALLGIILYDRLINDIFDEHTTRYLISSTLLVVLGSNLANILRIGKRNGA